MATAGGLDGATLQRTRDTLGKIIKKPPLTDKLLSRPPFRYLHDIITEIMKATGFYRGLYAGTQLDSKSFLDKESKMAFLQRAIDVLSFVQGDVVRVKASRIVAGQEAERTNEFLQLLSIAILKKLDSSEAVQKVLNGERPANKKRGGIKEGEKKEGERGGKREGERAGEKSGRPPEAKGRSRGDKPKEVREKEKLREKGREGKREQEPQPQKSEPPKEERGSGQRGGDQQSVSGEGGPQVRRETESGEDEGLGSETRLDRPSSARGHRHDAETEQREEETGAGVREGEKAAELAQKSPSPPPPPPAPPAAAAEPTQPHTVGLIAGRRPGSARPAPPRVVRQGSSDDITSRTPIDSSVAPPTVIMDIPTNNEEVEEVEEEDKEYEIGDSAPLAPPTNEAPNILQPVDGANEKPEGVLTKTMVATKERLEGVGGGEREGETEMITPAQRKREMEAVKKEMEKLREDIQLLCRYTNPMGRVMDYLQEDTDTMVQELERWRAENNSHSESLHREESITENELAPLKSQLEEVELHISEQRDKISAVKATIIRQDDHIKRLMKSITPHS